MGIWYGEKRFNLLFTHLLRMPFIMVWYETFRPVDVYILGSPTIMIQTSTVTNLMQKFRFGGLVLHDVFNTSLR